MIWYVFDKCKFYLAFLENSFNNVSFVNSKYLVFPKTYTGEKTFWNKISAK